jgi:hypothetical protein
MKKQMQLVKNFLSRKKQPLITISLLSFVVVGYQNCQQNEEFYDIPSALAISAPAGNEPSEPLIPSDPSEPDTNICENGSSSDLICNPLGGGDQPTPGGGRRNGLIATLIEGKSGWGHLDKYVDGYKHPEDLYFSNFNVPKRSFLDGFGYSDTDYLKNQNGAKLIEWFSIKARGYIGLPEDAEEGYYHIATITDDGIRINVDGKLILANANEHAPTLDCASELVHFTKGKELPFELSYFQGPRYEIALMTFIKKIDDPSTFKKSSFCSSGQGPETLVNNGYKVISPDWFTLPDGY